MPELCNTSFECVLEDISSGESGFGLCIQGRCECSILFGWIGEACSEGSSLLLFSQIFFFLRAVLYIILLLIGIKLSFHLKSFQVDNLNNSIADYNKSKKLKKHLFLIALLTTIGALGLVISNISVIRTTFDPSYFNFVTLSFVPTVNSPLSDDGVLLVARNSLYFILLEAMGMIVFYVVSYFLIVTWTNILKSVRQFTTYKKQIKYLLRFRNVASVVILVCSVLLLVFILTRNLLLVFVTIFISDFLLVILFLFASIYFRQVFRQFSVDKTVKRSIQLAVLLQLFGYGMDIIILSLFIFLPVVEEVVPGRITLQSITFNVLTLRGAFLIGANFHYTIRALKNLKSRSQSRKQSFEG